MKVINIIGRWVFGILCTLIGLYPIIYLLADGNVGLLTQKSQEILESNLWQIAFYSHIIPGGIALLIGWLQFSKRLRNKNMGLHRTIGKVYVVTAVIGGLSGVYLGVYANEGIVSQTGFTLLGIVWVITTLLGYSSIKRGDIEKHQQFMLYSYAVCFAAVSLRLWMPILIMTFKDPALAFKIVAWWCWVPNLIVVHLYWIRRTNQLRSSNAI
ncbi:DUF2306 domain-containing protein [Ekhidna sp.]